MSETERKPIVIEAPVPKAEEYTASAEIWSALMTEVDRVKERIENGEELVPEDVENVRNLRKQVESYLTTFNKAMRGAQAKYKELVLKQLDDIGYPVIENYIKKKQKEQTDMQNARLSEKQNKLLEIVEGKLEETTVLKTTVIAGELLPAFKHRFPKINSAAKSNEITNWGPYESVVGTTLTILDTFFNDKIFEGATLLPLTSATIQQLLSYVRDGNLEHLKVMRDIFKKDAEILNNEKLKIEIKDKETALAKIENIIRQNISADQKVKDIANIIRIAETL